MNLFDLVAVLKLDSTEYEQGLDKSESKASTMGGKIKNAFGVATKAGAALTGAVVAGGAAVAAMAGKAASTTDHIDKMSQKIGVSREAYQELDFVLSQSGTSVDGLRAGMKTMTAAMTGAANGTEKNVEQFKKLGIAVQNSDGSLRSQEDVFFDTVAALQKMDNQTEKARLATELFGKSGSELMPLLNGASGSIEEMRQQAHDLGLVLDDETIDAGVHLTDTIDQAKRSFDSIMVKIGAQLMPIVQQALDFILAHMPEIQSVMSVVFKFIGKFVTGAVGLVKRFIGVFQKNLPSIKKTATGAFGAVVDLWEKKLKPAFQAIGKFITDVVVPVFQEKFLPIIVNVFNGIIAFWNDHLKPCFEAIGNFIQNVLLPIFKTVFQNIILPLVKNLVDYFKEQFENLKNILGGVLDFITGVFSGDWGKAWEGIKDVLGGIWDMLVTAVKGFVTTMSDIVIGVWNSIKEKAIGIWDGIKTAISEKIIAAKDKVLEIVGNIKDFLNFEGLVDSVKTIFENIKNGIKDKIEFARDKVSAAVDKVKEFLNFEGLLTAVRTVFNNIKDAIKSKIEFARDKVSEAVDKVKGFLNFEGMLTSVRTIFNNVRDAIKSKIETARDKLSGAVDKIKEFLGFDGATTTVRTTFNNIREILREKIENARDKVQGGVKKIKEFLGFDGLLTTVQTKFNNIKDAIKNKIEWARDKVKEAIEKIKSFFNFSWSLPSLKLPHIKIVGNFSLAPPSVPHFSLSWYKKAMDNPILLRQAEIFGMGKDGTLLGGGEAGDEVVVGKDTMINMIQSAVSREIGNINMAMDAKLNEIVSILSEYMPGLANIQLVTDTGVLVGEIIPQVDEGLGRLQAKRSRGL